MELHERLANVLCLQGNTLPCMAITAKSKHALSGHCIVAQPCVNSAGERSFSLCAHFQWARQQAEYLTVRGYWGTYMVCMLYYYGSNGRLVVWYCSCLPVICPAKDLTVKCCRKVEGYDAISLLELLKGLLQHFRFFGWLPRERGHRVHNVPAFPRWIVILIQRK